MSNVRVRLWHTIKVRFGFARQKSKNCVIAWRLSGNGSDNDAVGGIVLSNLDKGVGVIAPVPLIRAGALGPVLKWLSTKGIPIERRLREARLQAYPFELPDAPILFANMLKFVRTVADRDGIPDFGCRSVLPGSIVELGTLGILISSARTPREALLRVARAMPFFCTHQHFHVGSSVNKPIVQVRFSGDFDPVALHIGQQHSATLVKFIVGAASLGRSSLLRRVELPAWPAIDLDLIRPWLCDDVVPSTNDVLTMHFAPGALDRVYSRPASEANSTIDGSDWGNLAEKGLKEALYWLVDALLSDGRLPTVRGVAESAGLKLRTLQRLLAENGTSFSEILDDVRRTRAIAELSERATSLFIISSGLGYSEQSSLSRSMRRWTANTARHHRFSPDPKA